MPGSSFTMSRRCAAISRAFASGVRASVHLLANTSGLSEHLPRALAAFLREHPDINVDVEERESTDIASAIATGAADLGFAAEHALPDNIERFAFSEDRLTLVTARRGALAGRRQIDFQDVGRPCLRRADQRDRAAGRTSQSTPHGSACACISGRGCGISTRSARWSPPTSALPWCRRRPPSAARESMPIAMIRIRDSWANRRLVICARSFKTLPRPAKLLVEHLRKAAA